nr:unnamed protein product [Callosobruchus analis]CAI5838957.1 unnamed protein product [Callosobruchus analis]
MPLPSRVICKVFAIKMFAAH